MLALCIAGCSSNSIVQVSSGGAPPPATGGAISVSGTSTLGALFSAVLLGTLMSGGAPFYSAPEMDPSRRVVEQDCSKPIEDWSANLKCR